MNTTRTRIAVLLAAALGAALPAPAALSPSLKQWIVTSAHATGPNGENFVTSVRLVNATALATQVNLTFLKQTALDGSGNALGDNTGALPIQVTVNANSTLAIDDIIATQFGNAANAGGIRVDSTSQPISVLSQTLVTNGKNQNGTSGTYGLAIPGQILDEAIGVGDTGVIPYICSAPDLTAGYRSNVFFLTTNSAGNTVVHVKLAKGDGSVVGEKDLTLGRLAQTQFNRIASQFGYTALDTNLTLFVTVKSGGPVFIGASVLDNALGSQYYAPATKTFTLRDGYDYGLVLNDGGYDFSGRLVVYAARPDEITMGIVLQTCPQPDPVLLFFFQAFGTGQFANTSFTQQSDGSWTYSGSSTSASWAGSIYTNPDGSVYGTVTYTRAPASSDCPGGSTTFTFQGAAVRPYPFS